MKYLMTWMGTTSGSHLGRDDGYPEQKFKLIESFDYLICNYNKDAEYYRLESVDISGVVKAVNDLGR